jgi:lysophospholipid acyltransferase
VKQLPSILEVFGYAFFFPGFLTGPWADFKEYTNFTDMSAFESVGGTIPSPVGFLIKRLIMVGVAFVGYSFAPKFPVTMVITDEFMLNPFWYRLVMYFLAVELFYMKYYVVWWLGEGAAATVGIAFNGIDEKGNPKWDRMPMVDLITFKFGTNGTRDQTPSWNMPAQKWLKRYIHIRLVHLGLNTSQARLLTFITSAVWHGLYPGYYVFFVWCALFVEVGGMSRVVFWPLVTEADGKTPKKPLIYVWNAISMILLSGAVDYLAISFQVRGTASLYTYCRIIANQTATQLMAFESGWKAFKSVYFIGHIVWGLLMLSYFVKVICCRGKKPGKALGVNGTKHD